MLPVLFNQVEIRFSEEEFFAALQVLVLSGFTFILIISAGVAKDLRTKVFIPGGFFPATLGLETWRPPFGGGVVIPGPPFLSKKFFSPGRRPRFLEYPPASPLFAGRYPRAPNPLMVRRYFNKS